MRQFSVKEALSLKSAGEEVSVSGWVRTRRRSKTFSFLEINDGSCLANIQVVADEKLDNYESDIVQVTTGSSVNVKGRVAESPGKGQKYEIQAESIKIFSICPDDYPLQKKRHSFEFLRQIAHLRPRTNTIGAVTRIRNSLSFAIHTFFQERGFNYIHTPVITSSDCEGAGDMFRVTTLDMKNPPKDQNGDPDYTKDFFGSGTFLTVSGQLEAEIYAEAMSRVYTFGPTFRAENSNTPRHLAEFWMIEPEAAFYTLKEDMDLAEEFVKHCIKWVLEKDREDIDFFNLRIDKGTVERLNNLVNNEFKRLSYTEAIELLQKNNDNFEFRVSWGSDLQTEHEKYLTESVFGLPVIVYDYPREIKAFYMKENEDGKTVKAMDLLVPGIGELIGGSEREEDYNRLLGRIKESGLDEKDYWWYLDLRKYGTVPHSGFGLGFERLLLFVTGMSNIRDIIPFPRFPGNAGF